MCLGGEGVCAHAQAYYIYIYIYRNSDALGRELREAPLTRLWGHFLATTHRERGPLSPPFTTRVAEGISACSMVFHGVFSTCLGIPSISLERCARPIGLGNLFACVYSGYQAPLFMAGADPSAAVFSVAPEKSGEKVPRTRGVEPPTLGS